MRYYQRHDASNLLFTFLLLATLGVGQDAPAPASPTPTLLFVAELCNHGDRAPLRDYPSDLLPASRWPGGAGKLSAVGERAHYDVGARLRRELIDEPTGAGPGGGGGFLPRVFSPFDVYVRSAGTNRAMASAVSQIAGLYPPGSAAGATADVRVRFGHDALPERERGLPRGFQPFPLHSERPSRDAVLVPGAACPRHDAVLARRARDPALLAVQDEASGMLRAMAQAAGLTPTATATATHVAAEKSSSSSSSSSSLSSSFSLRDAVELYDAWACACAHGVPLPRGATDEMMQFGRNATRFFHLFDNGTPELRRLRAGPLLHVVRAHMARAARRWRGTLLRDAGDAGQPRKFVLLSGDGATIAATLSALGAFDGWAPAYNSTVLWRLLAWPGAGDDKSNGNGNGGERLAVRVEYNGRALRLPGCSSEDCPVGEYARATRDVTMSGERQRAAECATGWRRFAARAQDFFVHQQQQQQDDDEPRDDEFELEPEQTAGAKSPTVIVLVVAAIVVLICSMVGVARFVIGRKGYGRANEDDDDERDGSFMPEDPTLNRRILL